MKRYRLRAKSASAIALLLAVCVSNAGAALPGKVVGRGSASGQFAIATAQADVKRPKALYARFVGSVSNGTVIASCIKGYNVSANSYTRNRAGLHRIPIKPRSADSCSVTASIGGSGRIVIEIRAVR